MLVIVSADNQLTYPPESACLTVQLRQSDTVYTQVTKLGLALEDYMLTHMVTNAALVWATRYYVDPTVFVNLPTFRTDEIMFPNLATELKVGWAAGHANALIKWAATCRDAAALEFKPWPQLVEISSSTANLVWWAQRINLRVYGTDQ